MAPRPTHRPPNIAPEIWEMLSASEAAVSHHWVPGMVLRNFTQHPDQNDPGIWCQSVGRGAPRRSRVGAECAIRDHNTLATPDLPSKSLEALYGHVEADAAPALRKILTGQRCDERERTAMALLIAVQYTRTPRSRWEHTYLGEKAMTMHMIDRVKTERGVHDKTREFLTQQRGTIPTDIEVEAWIAGSIRSLETGRVRVRAPHDIDAGAGLLALDQLVRTIYNMWWRGLRIIGNELILGDHPVVVHDRRAGPGQPSAWAPSPDVEVTFPLAPGFCLLLRHGGGGPTYQEFDLSASGAMEINLRSIAHAWRHYYGPTEQSVQVARHLAKTRPTRLAKLRPVARGLVVGHRLEGATEPHKVDVFRAPATIKVSRLRKTPSSSPVSTREHTG